MVVQVGVREMVVQVGVREMVVQVGVREILYYIEALNNVCLSTSVV